MKQILNLPARAALAVAGLVISMALMGCEREPAAEMPPVAPLHVPADSGIAAFLASGPMDLGQTREEMRAQLGEPDSVTERTVENRHDPSVTDTVATLYWPGLAAEVHVAGYDGKEILSSLVLADSQFLQASSPLRLGDTADAVRAELGDPDSTGDGYLEYICDDCLAAGQEATRFVLVRDAVSRIEIRYWVE
jgi:hypothetical protein